jgi:hypothetical protein
MSDWDEDFMTPSEYIATGVRDGQWKAFDRILHWINEQEETSIRKSDLYAAVREMRPMSEPNTFGQGDPEPGKYQPKCEARFNNAENFQGYPPPPASGGIVKAGEHHEIVGGRPYGSLPPCGGGNESFDENLAKLRASVKGYTEEADFVTAEDVERYDRYQQAAHEETRRLLKQAEIERMAAAAKISATILVYIDDGNVFEYDITDPDGSKSREHSSAIVRGGYRTVRDGVLTVFPPHRIAKVVAKCPTITTAYPDRRRGT